MENLFSLGNKVVAITGGYGHLGSSISEGLRNAGAEVIILGRHRHKFDQQFSNTHGFHFVECDISSTQSIKTAFATIETKLSKIDVLINNAFYLQAGKVDSLSDEAWNFGIDGTLNSVHRCIREIIPYFRKQKGGRIINVSSMYGVVAPDFDVYNEYISYTNPPHYGAAKAGVIQLTKYFASLLGKEQILVNCVSPGPFPSKAVQESKGFIEVLAKKTPLGRIGQAQELQGVFVFLASEASTYITGQNISIDGGWTII